MADKNLNWYDRRHILMGRIEEANFWIDYFGSLKSKYAKRRLEEAKRLRDKDMEELKKLQ